VQLTSPFQLVRSSFALALVAALTACGDLQPGSSATSPSAVDVTVAKDAAIDIAASGTETSAVGATPVALQITPNQGPTSGLQVVTIQGQALGHVQTVLFGDTPALQVDVQDDGELQVVAPPHPSGVVDVILRVAADPTAKPVADGKISKGYRYVGQVEVTGVTPKHGPAQGGTALTIAGNGFTAQTQFVVGHRLALLPSVIDEHTATVLTPPGETGTVALAASNGDGSGQLANAFTYQQPPTLDSVTPAVLPWLAKGGSLLTLHGHGLSGNLLGVKLMGADGPVETSIVSTTGELLIVTLGAEPAPGVYDVAVQQADGVATLPQAVALVQMPPPGTPPDDNVPAWALLTVTPGAQAVNQLQPVNLGVSGHATAAQWQQAQVAFGMLPAKILNVAVDGDGAGATLQVQPPATPETNLPQAVNVDVLVAGHTLEQIGGFQYLPASLHIETVTPKQLAPDGGTPFTLTWTPHGLVQPASVRIGALLASQLLMTGPGTLTGVAPPGSPGPADVTLILADGSQTALPHAVEFVGAGHAIYAVLPAVGAQAGGTWVNVVGAGLDGLQGVLFGGAMASDLKVQDSAWATLRTPRGEPGPVDVTALWGAAKATLPHGFTYFDPRSGNGGTWGALIGESLNITVVKRSDSATPIPGALVIATSGATTWHGMTDDRGQVTFSGPGMAAPVNVHASKAGYTAGSLIALSAENATIRLSSATPSSGNGSGDTTPPALNGSITGTVLDAEKYTVLPNGTCNGEESAAGNCLPCTSDATCGKNASCELLGLADATTVSDGGFCATTCVSLSDCPDGFTCSQFGAGSDARWRCRPKVGDPQIRCEPAAASIYGSGSQQAGGIVDAQGHYSLSVTPGATAVICRSGYVDKHTQQFVPLTIGVTRHLFSNPGQLVTGVPVHVRVPLNREIRVHMVALPMGPDTDGGQRSVTAGIDLGADGYIAMGQTTTKEKADTLLLTGQPSDALFVDDGADLRYEFYGGVATSYGGPPMSVSSAPGRAVIGLEHAAVWHPDALEPQNAKTAPGALHAFASAGETRVGVGDGGHIAAWTGTDFTVQASPTSKRLDAVWLANDDAATAGLNGWAGGENGVLVRRSPLGWQIWPQNLGGRVVALQGRNAKDVWALHEDGSLHHWQGDPLGKWLAGNGPTLLNQTAHALALLPNDAVLIGGDGGALWLGKPILATNNHVWQQVNAGTSAAIRALLVTPDGTAWLAGDRGYLATFDGQKVTVLTSGTSKNLYALYGEPLNAVGQTGTWLRVVDPAHVVDHSLADMPVDLRGVLPTFDGGLVAAGEPIVEMGPYLEMPYLTTPAANAVLGQLLDWTVAPGHAPTLNLIRIADASYTTRWEIFLHGNATHADLPDFPTLGAFSPLPAGSLYIRQWRILAPQLDIDTLNPKLVNQAYWISWTYSNTTVASPMGKNANFDPTLPPSNVPGATPWPK
jgi:hypothetical protein